MAYCLSLIRKVTQILWERLVYRQKNSVGRWVSHLCHFSTLTTFLRVQYTRWLGRLLNSLLLLAIWTLSAVLWARLVTWWLRKHNGASWIQEWQSRVPDTSQRDDFCQVLDISQTVDLIVTPLLCYNKNGLTSPR